MDCASFSCATGAMVTTIAPQGEASPAPKSNDEMRGIQDGPDSHHEVFRGVVPKNCAWPQGYDGLPKDQVAPVFRFICRWRTHLPEAVEIARRTNSTLDHSIILSLMEAARRLDPTDDSLAGIEGRRLQERQRAEEAQMFEDAFVDHFRRNGFDFLRECEQRSQAGAHGLLPRATPDIWFPTPVTVCGHLCNWIEYKHYFGFPKNPYVASKEESQIQKYFTEFGPGAIVFELGFQSGHLKREGVNVCRAKDVIDSLTLTTPAKTPASATV